MTHYEELFSKRENWVSLGDLVDEKNQLNINFSSFLKAFSVDMDRIFVSLFPFGVLSGLVENQVQTRMLIFAPTFRIGDIPEYLNKDGCIVYPITSDHSIYEDYPVEKKRKDFIDRIFISHKNLNVPFSNISHIDPKILAGFKILCHIQTKGRHIRDIDLVEYWNKLEQDDQINLDSDLVPRIYSD